MQVAGNFGFLSVHDAKLVQLGAQAERYFRDDPITAIIKLRQLVELMSKLIAARHALYEGERENFEQILRRLSFQRVIPKEAADIFHAIRKVGNSAVHEAQGTHSDALTALKFARQLSIWFHRTYGNQSDFKPGAFVPPPDPAEDAAKLKAKIEALEAKIAEIEAAAANAIKVAAEQSSARETAEERLIREAEERSVWESLAGEFEAQKLQLAERLAQHEQPMMASREEFSAAIAHPRSMARSLDADLPESPLAAIAESLGRRNREVEIEPLLAAIQVAASAAPKSETEELIKRGELAAAQIDLDESATRHRFATYSSRRSRRRDCRTIIRTACGTHWRRWANDFARHRSSSRRGAKISGMRAC